MAGSTISLDSLSSPSPSPSPPPEPNKPAEPTSAGLDSDSELSELTEEEQEAEKREESKDSGIRGTRNHAARRGRRPSRRGGRRKTSSMVPAPMWGWAEVKSSNVVEEEEEEEMAGPPKAMEEEEDEEADEDEDSSLSVPPPPPVGQNLDGDLPEEEEEPSDHFTVNAGEDDGSMSGDDSVTYQATRSTRRSTRNLGPPRVLQDDGEITSSEDDEAEPSVKKVGNLDDGSDVEEADDDEHGFETGPTPNGPVIQSDNENETESDEDDPKAKLVDNDTSVPSVSPVKPASLAMQLTAALMDVDIDVTAPPLQDIAPLAAAAAASSIMAGSTVIDPPSPTPSSSVSVSRASSRSPSPALPIKGSGRDGIIEEAGAYVKHPQSKETDASIQPTKGASVTLDMDAEIPETEFDNTHERSADEIDVDDINMDDDLEVELDSDLQPAHRAQALDTLALIEIKFADLRERVYLEKMENLAWEETLVGEGTHPELIHLHKELSQRRDKRLELASHKRFFETENVAKRRRSDEEATWSWWMFSRDELQTDMISETNRKRRRLERERRVIERPQPARRLPSFLQDVPLPPSLRSVVKSFPVGDGRHNKRDNISNSNQFIYPELSILSPTDITNDLDFLFQTRDRRPPYELHRGIGVSMSLPLGAPLPTAHVYDQYNDEILPPPFGSGGHRMHPPPFQHHLHGPPPLQPGPGFPQYGNTGRASQPSHPLPPQNHVHQHGQSPFPADLDMAVITGPGQILPHHPYFGSQGGSSSGYVGGQQPTRRTPSPINSLPNGVGSKPNGSWMGAGMGMGGIYPGPVKTGPEWHRDGHRNEQEDEDRERGLRDQREKERERERERERDQHERDQREREREHREGLERERRDAQHMQQVSQQHRHPPQHSHNVPPGQPLHQHITGPHHHHRPHHHHVVHHHHSPPQPGSSSGHAPSPMPPSSSGRSPRSSREYDSGRSHIHTNHKQHPTEIINLSSAKPSHWKDDHTSSTEFRDVRNKHGSRPTSGPIMDDRDRSLAMPFVMSSTHSIQHSSAPPSTSTPHNDTSSPRGAWNPSDDGSFRLPPSSSAPAPSGYVGAHEHFYSSSTSSHLGRGPPPSQPSRQNSLGLSPPRPRPLPPPSPSSSSSAYPNNANPSRSPTRFGPPPPLAPSRSPVMMKMRPTSPLANKMLSGPLPPGPPPASSYSPQLSGPGRTSTPTGLPSPADIKNGMGSSVPSTYPVSSRTASPLMPFPSPSSHQGLSSRTLLNSTNGPGDRERHGSPRLSVLPPPPPSKMSLPQMIDGH